MPDESLLQQALRRDESAGDDMRSLHDDAWRKTLTAALRVIDHHRTNLEARIAIQRVKREDPKPAADPPDATPSR